MMQRSMGFAAALVVMSAAAASAQTQPLPPGPPPPMLVPMPMPLPPGGCVWAGRSFSEGAQFCFAPRVILKCNSGKWNYDGLDACTGMTPIDTR